jgi:hypothetical protein
MLSDSSSVERCKVGRGRWERERFSREQVCRREWVRYRVASGFVTE